VMGADERRRVLEEWNATAAEYPAGECAHHRFEAQAARTPDAVAVVHEGRSLSYGELNARANQLAHHLRGAGVGPDARVGICAGRGVEMLVGVLAILKAGGAYVPLDPAYPAERLGYMLRDSAPAALLTHGAPGEPFAGSGVPALDLRADAAAWAHQPRTNPRVAGLTPEHLCYVIYTSGSTGRPKGVMNQHRCVVNRLAWAQEAWGLAAGEPILCKTSLGFDGSLREIFWPLGVGARVVLARPDGQRDPDYLLDTLQAEGVRTVNLVPSLLQVLLEHPEAEKLSGVRQVLCGGEALSGALLQRLRERLPQVTLHNLYGPSEAATALMALCCAPEADRATVPVGRPTANARAYLLDALGSPVPVGVPGELYIGGVGVARGYLHRPALTAERFVPDPFSATPGARLYRTGDLGRWLADGRIEYLGRNDAQVKVRGFRIEPGEVEARLQEHAAVREAAVVAREDTPGDTRLVAYHVGGAVEAEALRAHLSARVPEYMVPQAYVRLDALPLTPSGKLDRRALPAPEADAAGGVAFEAPAGEVEATLARIWADVLGVERVGRWDHFFALGGHSLLATRVVSRVRAALGVELELRTVFEAPTLAGLAERVDALLAAAPPRGAEPPHVRVERIFAGEA
ncbi:MAG TPA: amino acid adenylation domain-containing protein, partial [Longimicrobium sp.]